MSLLCGYKKIAAYSFVWRAARRYILRFFCKCCAFSWFTAICVALKSYGICRSGCLFDAIWGFFNISYDFIVSGYNNNRFRTVGYRSDSIAVSVYIIKLSVFCNSVRTAKINIGGKRFPKYFSRLIRRNGISVKIYIIRRFYYICNSALIKSDRSSACYNVCLLYTSRCV